MKDTQQKLFTGKIVIEDSSQFYYTVKPYELSNALGNIITILQEYSFIKLDDASGQIFCKLYKTIEGNWYDIEKVQMGTEKKILRMLKSAIDSKGNNAGLKGGI